MGRPGDIDQQRRVLWATLDLLGAEAPQSPLRLSEV
jgi:hypothetical protein